MKATNLFCLTAAAILATGCTRPHAPVDPVVLERSKEGVRLMIMGGAKFSPDNSVRHELRGQKLLVSGLVEVDRSRDDLGRRLHWAAVFDLPSQAVEFAAIDAPLGGSADDQVAHYLSRPPEEKKPVADMFKYLIATHQRPRTAVTSSPSPAPLTRDALDEKAEVPTASASPSGVIREDSANDSDDGEDEDDHPTDEDCGFWQQLAPNEDFEVVIWSIPDPKHVSRRERRGFCVVILYLPVAAQEHVIARHDFVGLRVSHMKWSPDSKFLLFTATSSGGHSPSHCGAFVFCLSDKSFRDVEAKVGGIVSPKFRFEPPDVAVMSVQTKDFSESEAKIPLGKTMRDMRRIN